MEFFKRRIKKRLTEIQYEVTQNEATQKDCSQGNMTISMKMESM